MKALLTHNKQQKIIDIQNIFITLLQYVVSKFKKEFWHYYDKKIMWKNDLKKLWTHAQLIQNDVNNLFKHKAQLEKNQ